MNVDSVSVGLIILPLPLKDVSIDMPEFTLATSLIETPISFVTSAIGPNLNSVTVLHVPEPLPFINGPILKDNLSTLFELLLTIVYIDVSMVIVRYRKIERYNKLRLPPPPDM
jgi:hypothetical protein